MEGVEQVLVRSDYDGIDLMDVLEETFDPFLAFLFFLVDHEQEFGIWSPGAT
jgi:hypothetical protein